MKAYNAFKMSNPRHFYTKKEILDYIRSLINCYVYNEEPFALISYDLGFDDSYLSYVFEKLVEEGYNIIHHEDEEENEFIVYWGKSSDKNAKGEILTHSRDFLPWSSIDLFLCGDEIKFDHSFLTEFEIKFVEELIKGLKDDFNCEQIDSEVFVEEFEDDFLNLDCFIDILISFKGYYFSFDDEDNVCTIKHN